MAIDIGGMLARSGATTGQLMGQGLANLGTGISAGVGGMLTRRREREQRLKEKGIFGGTRAVQQAAQSGQLTQEMLNSYIGSMEGLGVPYDKLLGQINSLQETNAAAMKKARTGNFINSLGEKYVDLYNAGVPLKEVREQHLEDNKQQAFQTLISNLDIDIDPALASNMTAKQLFDIMEDQKEKSNIVKANQEWATWVKENQTITDANRKEGLAAATKVFGADAPAKFAELEAKYLANEAKRQGKNLVKGVMTLNTDAMFADMVGMQNKSNLKPVELSIDSNGNLTEASIKFLEDNATSAFIPSINKSWSLDPETSNTVLGGDTSTPSGQGGESSTLGQVIGPEALNAALEEIGDFN
tara:strand:- start:3250 stop:4320 length:1071 start_codon:yes stop_codon:yes gene_type:complete